MNDRFSAKPEYKLTPKAALLLATITITAIDGDLDEDEIAIINRLDGSTTSEAWDSAISVWNVMHVDECVTLIAETLDPKQQRVALANMVDIAMADGFLDEAENLLLRAYAGAFDVSDADIEKIVDVITIKNNKSIF
ncbi:MAG: TerB family tellurite resistance protein [Arenicella sp.]|nr:TerB family tellurite resistance protein [Arenicella sp.]